MSRIYAGKAKPKTFDLCRSYHIDCGEGQCWAIVERTNVLGNIRKCGCEGNADRCDFKKVGSKCSTTS